MNEKTMVDVEVLFSASKYLDPSLRDVKFSYYTISSIPTAKKSLTDSHENILLKFCDSWEINQRASNPEKEADYILSMLSLFLHMRVEFESVKINNVQGTIEWKHSSFLNGKMTFPSDFKELFKNLNSLDMNLLRQYLRSCSAYRTALSLIDINPTLSFFLLVTAIEAISNQVIKGKEMSENFRKFILRYLPSSFEEEIKDKKLLELLIKQAYKMRSAFTHGGSEISIGSLSADSLNRIYAKHYVKEKEVYSPSLRWFENVVYSVLIEFLRSKKAIDGEKSKLPSLALEEATLFLKATRALKAGQVITGKDVDLDYQPNE